jgi:hypothetical protein
VASKDQNKRQDKKNQPKVSTKERQQNKAKKKLAKQGV